MRRVAIVAALGVLSALYLYSAFAPGRRRNASLPFKIGWVRRLLHGFLGVVLLLCFLFLVYAGLMSTIDD
jgi:Ni,Fe-hydrogenase I cytochrome b subunit